MKASIIISSIIILILFLPFDSKSCSCIDDYIENYCETASENDFIALVKITNYISLDKRKVSILENINNEIIESEITLFGSDQGGANCGENLESFSLGDTVLMSLSHQGNDEYMLFGSCGINYLKYSNGQLQGNLYPNVATMDYEEFKTNLEECINFEIVNIETIESQEDITVYPNPIKNHLELKFQKSTSLDKIEIYSIDGKRIMEYNRSNLSNENITLDFSRFNKGLYFLKIKAEEKTYITKIIKE